MTHQLRNRIFFCLALVAFVAPVHAVTTVWDGGALPGNTNWGAAGNWAGNVAPPATNDVEFGSAFTSGTNIQLAASRTVNSLIINTLLPLSISGGASDVLTLTSGILTRDDPDGEEGNHTINATIALGANATWSVWGSGTLAINGPINGVGRSLTKYGWGNLLLSNGSGSYSGGTFVEESTVEMTGVWNGTGPINVAQAAGLDVSAATISNPINLRGDGFENWGALRALSGSAINGPITLLTNSTITAKADVLTINGVITDNSSGLSLTKSGAAELRLNAINTYKGGTIINEGTLSIAGDSALGTGDVNVAAGKLLYTANTSVTRDFVITNGRLQANPGVNVALNGSQIRGGFIAGPGTFSTSGGSSLLGATTLAGANLAATGQSNFVNFINGGNITASAPISWDGGMNLSSGAVTLNSGSLATTAFSNDGIININNGASLTNTASNLVSGGGSRITIAAGGTLDVSGNALHLNGALLVNNGTILGPTNVNFGSVAKGGGVFGAVNVTDGGKFSPGNSPGAVTTGATTWHSGGSYVVELADAFGAPGHDWDLWNIDGTLTIDATASTNGRFVISIASLLADAPGPATNFDSHQEYYWTIVHTSGGIAGFDSAELALDTSNFTNSLNGGHFSLEPSANDLILHFSAVPEPGLIWLGCGAGLFLIRRRRVPEGIREKIL